VGRAFGLLVSAVAAVGGIAGVIRPSLYRSSMQDQYTPWRARIGAIVLLLMGLAGFAAILIYGGEPVDFFPA
jgi:hypothetical protein